MASYPHRPPAVRCAQFVRQWTLAVLLRRGRWPLEALARQVGCTTRTVRRDLEVLQAAGLPVRKIQLLDQESPVLWAMGGCTEWPRAEATPVHALSASLQYQPGAQTETDRR